ncbi:lipoprotein [Dielma fastidiosa]|uniref:LptM family lipoprotein n=1 Tax=Dielma fastidiosa TaxID=1034346 RepID=UPI000E54A3D9|nr:hypothetical protein [Dielma fastidiosa]RHM99115.1 hypothetical protein DWZ33_12890 [Dielma fastidiosa]
MKKILTSFLLMAMIAGCVQQGPTEAEKPEEPPVVEQSEKPVEQEKPEVIKYVKKIDENKDWVYFDEPLVYNYELSDYEAMAVTYYNENNMLNIEMPIINIDLSNIKTLNQSITNQLYKAYETVSYYDNKKTVATYAMSRTRYYIADDILSVETRTVLIYGEEEVQINVYNIDLTTGEILSNADLLSRYDLDFAKVEKQLVQALSDQNISICELHEGYSQVIDRPCYFDDAIKIDEKSLLMLNNQNQLVCIMKNYYCEDNTQGYPYAKTETELIIKSL